MFAREPRGAKPLLGPISLAARTCPGSSATRLSAPFRVQRRPDASREPSSAASADTCWATTALRVRRLVARLVLPVPATAARLTQPAASIGPTPGQQPIRPAITDPAPETMGPRLPRRGSFRCPARRKPRHVGVAGRAMSDGSMHPRMSASRSSCRTASHQIGAHASVCVFNKRKKAGLKG